MWISADRRARNGLGISAIRVARQYKGLRQKKEKKELRCPWGGVPRTGFKETGP